MTSSVSKIAGMVLVDKNDDLSILRQCSLLSLPRSSYYYQSATETAENIALMRRICKRTVISVS